ncbi:hypothetical protein [Piscirickettsia litoralis]|uniref:Uncharacterized protein n=1 Tax=Piscirickettsia litoralis TaxID=1891921 RepID=A0ABX3A310_9GAMM|nr:hypothetical protein [Piscirickettsia litoralis]ODN42008.1 hypothetical protein BGC07_02340 [Piscirickettsia litoralis]
MNEVNKVGSGPPPLANKQAEEKAPEQQKQATSAAPATNEESLLLTELVQSASQDEGFTTERAEKVETLKALYQKR